MSEKMKRRTQAMARFSGTATAIVLVIVVGTVGGAIAGPTHPASSRAGRLDSRFGRGGKATVPAPPRSAVFHPLALGYTYGAGRETAVGPDGEIAILREGVVVDLTAAGKLNTRFSHKGRLRLGAPEGLQFHPTAIAVDSENRLLIAGTTTQVSPQSTPGPMDYPGPPPAWATLRRYLPNGKPDLTFGSDGAVNTDFGLPAPVSHPFVPGPSGVVISTETFHYQS
jgi:hypothetical protein